MPERLRVAVRDFVRTMHNPYDLDELLDRLLSDANEALGCADAAILLEDDHGRLTVTAASSERVTQAERVPSEIQPGVCQEAFTTGEVVAISDLTRTDRWGDYGVRVVELGLRAVIGVPLTAWGQRIGVLDLYREGPTPWSDADVEVVEILAAMGAAYILGATRMQAQNELAEQLHAALGSRGTIERAKGIIMQRDGVDADTAFDRLRTTSMNSNQKVSDLANQIIEHHENRCPTLTTQATAHWRPSVTTTARGPDVNPNSDEIASSQAPTSAHTWRLADIATRGSEQPPNLNPEDDEEPSPAERWVGPTAASEVLETPERGMVA